MTFPNLIKSGRKFSKRLENTLGKRKIAHEQFLLFPQCFQKVYTADMKNQGLFGKGLNLSKIKKFKSSKLKEFADNFKFEENGIKFSKRVENALGKGEIACYEQFLLFPQFF